MPYRRRSYRNLPRLLENVLLNPRHEFPANWEQPLLVYRLREDWGNSEGRQFPKRGAPAITIPGISISDRGL